MDYQTFATFWPKIAGGSVTKAAIPNSKSFWRNLFIIAYKMQNWCQRRFPKFGNDILNRLEVIVAHQPLHKFLTTAVVMLHEHTEQTCVRLRAESWVDSWVTGFCSSHELIQIYVC